MVPSSQRKSPSKCLLVAALLSVRLRSGCTWEMENSPETSGTWASTGALGQSRSGNRPWPKTPTKSWSSWGEASLTHFHEVPGGHPLPPEEQRRFSASSLPQHYHPTTGWYSSWPRRDEPFARELSFGHLQPERWYGAEDGTKNLAIHVQASFRAALN